MTAVVTTAPITREELVPLDTQLLPPSLAAAFSIPIPCGDDEPAAAFPDLAETAAAQATSAAAPSSSSMQPPAAPFHGGMQQPSMSGSIPFPGNPYPGQGFNGIWPAQHAGVQPGMMAGTGAAAHYDPRMLQMQQLSPYRMAYPFAAQPMPGYGMMPPAAGPLPFEQQAAAGGHADAGGHVQQGGNSTQANAAQPPAGPATTADTSLPSSRPRSEAAADTKVAMTKKPRVAWTPDLHKRFVDAVEELGVQTAVPKAIMTKMNVDGLTRENVASHLQKYRLQLKREQE